MNAYMYGSVREVAPCLCHRKYTCKTKYPPLQCAVPFAVPQPNQDIARAFFTASCTEGSLSRPLYASTALGVQRPRTT
eukprot:4709809-Pleurochrysis_carterae.AAC.2